MQLVRIHELPSERAIEACDRDHDGVVGREAELRKGEADIRMLSHKTL